VIVIPIENLIAAFPSFLLARRKAVLKHKSDEMSAPIGTGRVSFVRSFVHARPPAPLPPVG
jgi:hypothetical protein